ncbi:MAG: zinc metalloprotease HtpX [Chloroflexi bacterium]|nr:zinc metalloprotease HtpX [Chloroflexota bacterium]
MRRKWYGRDTQLTIRMFLTMFLLFAVYAAFMAVLWYIGVGLLPLVLIAAVFLFIQYYYSDRLVLWSMHAKIVQPSEAPELHGIIDRLAQMTNLPKPKVAIVNTSMPNAFATGRGPKSAVVAVTTGLMDRLDGPELEAVLAHEMTHIKNRDMAVLTIASFLSTLAFLMMRSFMFAGLAGGVGGRRGGRDNSGQIIILVYIASILVWVISYFLIRALSRYREYAADRGGAIITGAPSQLAAALLKISGVMSRIPTQDLRQAEPMNAFFIVPAVSGSSLTEIFSTHPSVEKRIERLKKLEQQMEGQ